MITLYDFGNSVCCQKVRITLVEKGLTWDAVRVDLFKSEQYDPNYLKMNPKGVVPTSINELASWRVSEAIMSAAGAIFVH